MGNKKVALKVENISIRFNLSKEKVDNLKELIIKKLKGQKIHFNEFWALKNINFELQKGDRLGILGLNGAGKSTFLRMVSGILKPDEGAVLIDGENVYENPAVKSRFFYISDDQYFFANGTPLELMKFISLSTRLLMSQDFSISYSPLIWTKRERSPHSQRE